MTVALTALELLVAALQAYVFAVLTSMYLNDAIHPSATDRFRTRQAASSGLHVPGFTFNDGFSKESKLWMLQSAKFIGAGLACSSAWAGAAIGVGNIFGSFLCGRAAQSVGRGSGPVR
jgi:hypothetical protein